ncbi:hypothetical protein M9H77_19144 [Catharanthus roseus]|uniref:Uncharacterized protein n=1 Tax=Catharanthus roseus TaxID=4058 RepID=A0ACC0B9H1_CATRO|nr:hypothetical protein M9H77_19144 [Catharanthus roseus]
MAASSSIRVFGSLLCRFSNGVSVKPHHKFHLQSSMLLRQKLTSSSSYSSYRKWDSEFQLQSGNSVRKIWTFSPLCMGRRSCKIAGRKTAQDAKKTKLYSKIGKEVVSAVKKGGPSPVSNTALAALFEKVKELDVPKEIVERNIKKASEKGQEAYIEKFYEVYGYGGAGIIVEVLTDKINRSVAGIRGVLKDCGGKMADSGSIIFKFRRARVANVKVTDVDRDQLLTIALDAGAEDVIEPSSDEDDFEEDISDRYYKVISSSDNYSEILSKLREAGIAFEPDNGSELIPTNPIVVSLSGLILYSIHSSSAKDFLMSRMNPALDMNQDELLYFATTLIGNTTYLTLILYISESISIY